jgi:hypothetical protein
VPSGALPDLPPPACSPLWRLLARVLGWMSVMLVAAATLGQQHRVAAAAVVTALLLVGSVRVGFPWATALAAAAAVVAELFVVRFARWGWDPRVDPYVVVFAFAVATVGMLLAWLDVVPRAAVAVRRTGRWVRRRLPGHTDADRRPSPRPFNHDERLWELELTRR